LKLALAYKLLNKHRGTMNKIVDKQRSSYLALMVTSPAVEEDAP